MKQSLFQEKYPIYTLEVDKSETSFENVDQIIDYLKGKIDAHKAACFIAVFDHYSHTKALEGGAVADDIRDAKNLVFCFGMQLPNPSVMAVRPRSIGVTELADKFVINFLEAPVQVANETMETWVRSVANK